MKAKKGYARKERVAKQVLQIVSKLLLSDVRDPLLANAQITDVEVSRDLRHAKVYWIPLESDDEREEIETALGGATSFLRRAIADEMATKYTPQLHFTYDDSVARGRRIDNLLAGLDVPAEDEEE